MKKITGENFGSISSTEEVGKPEQETKSAVIELDSPEALEKVWISDGIEVKNQQGMIETRGRYEKPVSLREINVALVDAYGEQQRWPEIRESLDKSREGRIIAVWMDMHGKIRGQVKYLLFQFSLLHPGNRSPSLNPSI